MTAGDAENVPEKPQGDDRPRPQFGELAPPGWDWKPDKPAVPVPRAADHPSVHDATGMYRAPSGRTDHHNAPNAPALGPTKPARRWDRPIAISLLIYSVFGVALAWQSLGGMEAGIQAIHKSNDLAAYVPAASVGVTLMIGAIIQGILWATSAWFTITRLRQKRRAAWIPLTAGVLSTIALFVVSTIVIYSDSVLMENLTKISF